MTRSFAWKALVLVLFSFALGFSYNYHLPKFEAFLLDRIERLSEQHSPVEVWADKLSFHLFPLGVVLKGVQVLPKAPLNRYLAPAKLKEVGARLAFLPLLHGEVRLSEVFIRDSVLNVFLKRDLFETASAAAPRRPPPIDLDAIYRLPIDELSLENVEIQGRLDPQNVVFRIAGANLTVENRYHSLFVDASAPQILVKPSGPTEPLSAEIELRTLVEAHEVQISAFKLKADQSFLVASGRMNGDLIAGRLQNGALNARAQIHLPDMNVWEKVFFLKPVLPELQGQLSSDFGVELKRAKQIGLEASLKGQQLKLNKFFIGDVDGELASDLKSITSTGITVANAGGRVRVSKLHVNLSPTPTASGDLSVRGLQLKEFLKNLNVHRVPVKLAVNGDAHCKGEWSKTPTLNCDAKMNVPRLHVDSGPTRLHTIVEADNLRAGGKVEVTPEHVQYQADIQVGQKSLGRSNGVIDYDKGFKIQYQAERLDLSDIRNLADLKLEGQIKLSGETSGDSHTATLSADAQGTGVWLNDYPIGHVLTHAQYKSGHLNFSNMHGQVGVSRYDGSVDLDLDKNTLAVETNLPFLDLKDVESVFTRQVSMPFNISGTGTGHLQAHGPLKFSELSYTLKSNFYRGQIAGESFDNIVFNLHADNGHVKADQIQIAKAGGLVQVTGQISPTGMTEVKAVGHGLRLEQSENLSSLGLDAQGLADFNVRVRGQLPRPKVVINGKVSHMVLGDHPTDDSAFNISFLDDEVKGSGQFFGSKVLTEFEYPYEDKTPFVFKMQTQDWDFTNLFAMISHSARQLDFSTAVTMDVSLSAPKGGFWMSSGRIHFDQFTIRKGGRELKADRPMTMTVKNGTMNSENFQLTSGENYLKLDVNNLSRDQLNAGLNGKLDLSFLSLFTPFISDLRGNMAISVALKGSVENPKISGSSYIDKGYVKLADFPHPFSQLRADILFNDNQILINDLKSRLAGGRLSAEGKVVFAGHGSRPIDVSGEFHDVNMDVPDGFSTQGSGTLHMSGSQFPYLLAITYNVDGGKVTSEFQQKGPSSANVQPSPYLPHFISSEGFHPLNLDLNVNLKNPISVNNPLMQASVTGHVHATGAPTGLVMNGTFTPQPGGKVFFSEVPFDIVSAYAQYDNAPPDNPKLYLSANARVTDTVIDRQQHTTQHQYDVTMLLQGTAHKPEINLSSQPPLNQNEIVSLLALGMTSATVDTATPTDKTAASTSSALGGALLQKAAGRRLKDALGVQVKVSTSQPTAVTAAAPEVILSKQVTPKFQISGSRTLESNPQNQVKAEFKMNKSVSVVGSWNGNESDNIQGQKDTTKNVFGLDLEYKVNFK